MKASPASADGLAGAMQGVLLQDVQPPETGGHTMAGILVGNSRVDKAASPLYEDVLQAAFGGYVVGLLISWSALNYGHQDQCNLHPKQLVYLKCR